MKESFNRVDLSIQWKCVIHMQIKLHNSNPIIDVKFWTYVRSLFK